jgi:hypothetical protein
MSVLSKNLSFQLLATQQVMQARAEKCLEISLRKCGIAKHQVWWFYMGVKFCQNARKKKKSKKRIFCQNILISWKKKLLDFGKKDWNVFHYIWILILVW